MNIYVTLPILKFINILPQLFHLSLMIYMHVCVHYFLLYYLKASSDFKIHIFKKAFIFLNVVRSHLRKNNDSVI